MDPFNSNEGFDTDDTDQFGNMRLCPCDNDCVGKSDPVSLIIVSDALESIGCIFNFKTRVLICQKHERSRVVPSRGDNIHDVYNSLQDHVRRNHPELQQPSDFYPQLFESLQNNIISSETLLSKLLKEPESISPMGGIPFFDGYSCTLCHYCGPKKAVQRHFSQFHKAMSFTLNTVCTQIQQYDPNSMFVPVQVKAAIDFVSPAWETLYKEMTVNTSEERFKGLMTESAFVKTSGWVGCVGDRAVEFHEMASPDVDQEMWPTLLKHVTDYFRTSNANIYHTNITVRRWIESRG